MLTSAFIKGMIPLFLYPEVAVLFNRKIYFYQESWEGNLVFQFDLNLQTDINIHRLVRCSIVNDVSSLLFVLTKHINDLK